MTTRRQKRRRLSPQTIIRHAAATSCSGAIGACDDGGDGHTVPLRSVQTWEKRAMSGAQSGSGSGSGSGGKSSHRDPASLCITRAAGSSNTHPASSSSHFNGVMSESTSNITGGLDHTSAATHDCSTGGKQNQASNTFKLMMQANDDSGMSIAERSIVRFPWTQFPSITDLFKALCVQHSILRKYQLTGATIQGRDGDGHISGTAALDLKMDTSKMCGGIRELSFTVVEHPNCRARRSKRKKKRPRSRNEGIGKKDMKEGNEWVVRQVLEHRNLGDGWQFYTEWKDWGDTWVNGSNFFNADGVVTEAFEEYLGANEQFAKSPRFTRWRDIEIKRLKEEQRNKQ